jgi:hypothetical protein
MSGRLSPFLVDAVAVNFTSDNLDDDNIDALLAAETVAISAAMRAEELALAAAAAVESMNAQKRERRRRRKGKMETITSLSSSAHGAAMEGTVPATAITEVEVARDERAPASAVAAAVASDATEMQPSATLEVVKMPSDAEVTAPRSAVAISRSSEVAGGRALSPKLTTAAAAVLDSPRTKFSPVIAPLKAARGLNFAAKALGGLGAASRIKR